MLPLRDNVPTRSRPVVTYALILTNVLVWVLYQLPDQQRSIDELGYHPCEVEGACRTIGQDWPVSAVTSMFLHGSWAHLLGNMLFLWIFGNNVEDLLGKVRFLVLYLVGGLAATSLQTYVTLSFANELDATIPNVGASGAVSAVLGAYLVLLPHAKVLTLIVVFLRELPAGFFLVVWFGFQLLDGSAALAHPEHRGGVAFFAHVGGFVFGALTAKPLQQRRPLAPRY